MMANVTETVMADKSKQEKTLTVRIEITKGKKSLQEEIPSAKIKTDPNVAETSKDQLDANMTTSQQTQADTEIEVEATETNKDILNKILKTNKERMLSEKDGKTESTINVQESREEETTEEDVATVKEVVTRIVANTEVTAVGQETKTITAIITRVTSMLHPIHKDVVAVVSANITINMKTD